MAEQRNQNSRPVRRRRKIDPAQDRFFLILKVAMAVFLAVYIIAIYRGDHTKNVSMDTISAVLEQNDGIKAMTKDGGLAFRKRYSINDGTCADRVYYVTDSMMDVSELLVVKTQSDAEMEELKSAAQRHLEEQKERFDGYGTNQTELLQHAQILEVGDYFFCGVSEEIDQWKEVFLSCVK